MVACSPVSGANAGVGGAEICSEEEASPFAAEARKFLDDARETLHEVNQIASRVNHAIAPTLGGFLGASAVATYFGGSALTVVPVCLSNPIITVACTGAAMGTGYAAMGAVQTADGHYDRNELIHAGASAATAIFLGANSIMSGSVTLATLLKDTVLAIGVGRTAAAVTGSLEGSKTPVRDALTDARGFVQDTTGAVLGQMAAVTGVATREELHALGAQRQFLGSLGAALYRQGGHYSSLGINWLREAEHVLMSDLRITVRDIPTDVLKWFGWSPSMANEFYQTCALYSGNMGSKLIKWFQNPELNDILFDAKRLTLIDEAKFLRVAPPEVPKSLVSRAFTKIEDQPAEKLVKLIPKLERWVQEARSMKAEPAHTPLSWGKHMLESAERHLGNYLDVATARLKELTQPASP